VIRYTGGVFESRRPSFRGHAVPNRRITASCDTAMTDDETQSTDDGPDAQPHGNAGHREPTGKRVLVVDDDADIVTMLQDRLESLGYESVTAEDGVRALELLNQDPPDLVLLDLEMPRMAGLEVLKTIADGHPKGTSNQPRFAATSTGGD